MRWKSHVRFGGRAGETHHPKGWQGAPVRPLLAVAPRSSGTGCCWRDLLVGGQTI